MDNTRNLPNKVIRGLRRRYRPIPSLLPRQVPFYWGRVTKEVDVWGEPIFEPELEQVFGKIDRDVSSAPIFVAKGQEIKINALIILQGVKDVKRGDVLYYGGYNGEVIGYEVLKKEYVHDLTGNAYQTKVTAH